MESSLFCDLLFLIDLNITMFSPLIVPVLLIYLLILLASLPFTNENWCKSIHFFLVHSGRVGPLV